MQNNKISHLFNIFFSFITSFLIDKNIKYIPGISLMLSYYFNVMYFIYIEHDQIGEDENIISVQETTLNKLQYFYCIHYTIKIYMDI